MRGVPPSPVDARMIEPHTPGGKRMYAFPVLECMLRLPPGNTMEESKCTETSKREHSLVALMQFSGM